MGEQLQKAIKEVPSFDEMKNHIDMTVTNEGLRIELTESEKGTFFESGSQSISRDGEDQLKVLADELGKLPNTIALEGHTDSRKTPRIGARPPHLLPYLLNWFLQAEGADPPSLNQELPPESWIQCDAGAPGVCPVGGGATNFRSSTGTFCFSSSTCTVNRFPGRATVHRYGTFTPSATR